MCKFYSCIVTQKGKVYDKLGVDSHTRLEEIYGLRDNGLVERCKVEVVPDNILDSLDKWTFTVDEERTPDWWNDGYKAIVLKHMKDKVLPKMIKRKGKKATVTKWYENGKKLYEENYVNGQQHGKQLFWYINNNKAYEDNYVNGKLQ